MFKQDVDFSNKNALCVLDKAYYIQSLHTTLRDKETPIELFTHSAKLLAQVVIQKTLEYVPYTDKKVTTALEVDYAGKQIAPSLIGISIVRAGESMEEPLRQLCPKVPIGKLLIQRNEATKQAQFYYSKLPDELATSTIILLEPMLATGGSLTRAIELLLEFGAKENQLLVANLLAAPEGIKAVLDKYPAIKLITSAIDDGLNEEAFIVPGLGDFGDRYYGT